MTLAVAHPAHLGVLSEDTCWLYADDDIDGYMQTARHFGESRRLLEPAAFQHEVLGASAEFLQWVDTALARSPTDYWITASFFKDIFCTPAFLHLDRKSTRLNSSH